MVKLATFGVLCVAALVVATFAYEDRRVAAACAKVVLVNWLLFAMPWIYNPLSSAHLLVSAGLPVTHEDMWTLADLFSLIIVAIQARDMWWAPMIWSVYLVNLCMHAIAWGCGLQYVEYAPLLDAGLVIQLAVLFLIGGDGFANYVLARWRGVHRVVRSSCTGSASSCPMETRK